MALIDSELAGLRVLVIEDESFVLMLLEDTLAEIGCEVAGTASRVGEALDKVGSLSFDLAILDVNLNGSQTLEVAARLAQAAVPFVFATGYGAAGLLSRFEGVPILQKPFQQSDLEHALRAALARSKAAA
jgi:CheY-like chemotaxis protein